MSEMTLFLMRLGIILIASHGAGFFFTKIFNLPRVLGEMGIGILLSYNLLGQLPILFGEPLFTPEILHHEMFEFFTNMATIILLFNAGMHTDIGFFLKFFFKGAAIGMAGVVVSFLGAAYITVLLVPGVNSILNPIAIFMGIATSTSVGISARILSDKNKLNSMEGNFSITAAVLDDVLGIIALAVASSIALAYNRGEDLEGMQIAIFAGREILFWLLLTIAGILVAKLLGHYLRVLTPYTAIGMSAMGFVLLMGGISEKLGLSVVIGAYILGLGFGRVDSSIEIQERMTDLAGFFVPVFFTLTGIQIDFISMREGIWFSLVYAVGSLAIKVIACGSIAGMFGFNVRGMSRIGTIMLPRGEVTLVVANIGLAVGVLSEALFGTLAFTVFLSVLLTPLFLMFVYKNDKSGYKKTIPISQELKTFSIDSLGNITQAYLFEQVIEAFRKSNYFVNSLDNFKRTYHFRKNDVGVVMTKGKDNIIFSTQQSNVTLVKLLLLEEIAEMQGSLEVLKNIQEKEKKLEGSLISGLLNDNKK